MRTPIAKDRQRLEASLHEMQELYRATFEQAPVGIAHADRDGRFITVNERFCELLGRGASEIVGRHFSEFAHPEDDASATTAFQDLVEGRCRTARYERRYLRPGGKPIWTKITLSSICDADGTLEYIIGLAEDITAQVDAREKLRIQARMLDSVTEMVIATDRSGYILYWNAAAERMLGWTAAETIGRHLFTLEPSPAERAHTKAVFATVSTGETWRGEITLTRRDGSTFPALVIESPLLADDGSLTGVVGLTVDLSEQKRIENELRANQMQLAQAQEISGVGSWTYDFTTGRREWSDALWRLFGMQPGPVPSIEDVYARVHPQDVAAVRAAYQKALESRAKINLEFRIVRDDGQYRTVTSRGRLLLDQNGKPIQLIGVMQDITERITTENDLRRHNVQQAAVANLGQIALTGATTKFLVDQACATVRVILGVDLCQVLQRDGEQYSAVASDGNADRKLTPLGGGVTVPIQTMEGETWGMLAVHARTLRSFSGGELDFLRSVATVLSQAMDRAHADAELAARARQQSAIAQLGSALLNSAVADVYDRACALLAYGLAADYSYFMAYTGERTLRVIAGRTWSDDLPSEIEIDARSQSGMSVLTGEAVVVEDFATDTRFDTRHRTLPYGIRSGLMVPVRSGARTLGVLAAHSAVPRHFRDQDLDFVQALANMLADATEREEGRHALLHSEHRYRRIFDGATEIIFHINAEGRFVLLNPAFEEITGWRRAEWLGRDFVELLAPPYRRKASAAFSQMIRNSTPANVEVTLLGNDREVIVEVMSFPQAIDGTVVEVYGFARDVTATRRATKERERVTRNLQLLLESAAEGIFTIDMDGRCTMVNRAAAAVLERPADELLGESLHELVHAQHGSIPGGHHCAISRALETGEATHIDGEIFWRRDGSAMPVALSAAPIVDGGVQIGVVVTFRDLTERKKLEARLEQAHRLSSLGRLAATVAHEFNNVLMGIAPFVEVVRRSKKQDSVDSALDHIASSVRRGRRITEDILRFTQPAEPVRARVDVSRTVRNVVTELRPLLPSRITIEVECDALHADADPNQLHQIITNLVLNARDAISGAGSITLSARREEADARFAFGVLDDPSRYVHLTVRDTGCGMSPETLAHAFEPLFTTKRSGTGLGLAVAHQVVLRHGGEIFIESAEGVGTTFHLFLPRSAEPEEIAIVEGGGERPASLHSMHILLVEDDSAVAIGLTALLEFERFRVTLATSGRAALESLQAELPDVVLLDVGLPDMEGTAVYAHIAAHHPALPVIFSTGHADRAQLEEVLARPNVSYLLKPYEIDSLLHALASVTR